MITKETRENLETWIEVWLDFNILGKVVLFPLIFVCAVFGAALDILFLKGDK